MCNGTDVSRYASTCETSTTYIGTVWKHIERSSFKGCLRVIVIDLAALEHQRIKSHLKAARKLNSCEYLLTNTIANHFTLTFFLVFLDGQWPYSSKLRLNYDNSFHSQYSNLLCKTYPSFGTTWWSIKRQLCWKQFEVNITALSNCRETLKWNSR